MLKKLSLLSLLVVSFSNMIYSSAATQTCVETKTYSVPKAVVAAAVVGSAIALPAPIVIGGCTLGLGWYAYTMANKIMAVTKAALIATGKVVLPSTTTTIP